MIRIHVDLDVIRCSSTLDLMVTFQISLPSVAAIGLLRNEHVDEKTSEYSPLHTDYGPVS